MLEALLRRVREDGWQVVDGVAWSSIRKFKVGAHADAEHKNVLGLILQARERGADVVAFARDCDGDGKQHRQRSAAIEAGLAEAQEVFPNGPTVVGGVAVRMLEAWVLALAGKSRTEELGRDGLANGLKDLKVDEKDTRAMVAVVEAADLGRVPGDAVSLSGWLGQARRAFGAM